MINLRRLPLILVTAFLLSSCAPTLHDLSLVSPDGKLTYTVKAEVADSPEKWEKGLMNRKELPKDQGMLFVFPQPSRLGFWMKDTLIPLNILFFGPDGTFINSMEMVPCVKDPCQNYMAAEVAQFALEVNKGFAADKGIGVGWKLDLGEVAGMTKTQ